MAEIIILRDGYANLKEDGFMYANCTCTVVITPLNTIIVDTMTPCDGPFILDKLKEMGIDKDQITYCVSSHGHPDHTGNNNLFLSATHHIVGFCIENKDQFYAHPFEHGDDFIIDEYVSVTPSPGHTNEDVSVIVKTREGKTIAIVGDLFECENDTEDSALWTSNSFDTHTQAKNRLKVLRRADIIIPGHGTKFDVTPNHIKAAERFLVQFEESLKS